MKELTKSIKPENLTDYNQTVEVITTINPSVKVSNRFLSITALQVIDDAWNVLATRFVKPDPVRKDAHGRLHRYPDEEAEARLANFFEKEYNEEQIRLDRHLSLSDNDLDFALLKNQPKLRSVRALLPGYRVEYRFFCLDIESYPTALSRYLSPLNQEDLGILRKELSDLYPELTAFYRDAFVHQSSNKDIQQPKFDKHLHEKRS